MTENENILSNEANNSDERIYNKCKLTLEPPMLFMFFAVSLTGEVFANEIFYRTCMNTLEKNETTCSFLLHPSNKSSTNNIEALVQPLAAKILMARSLIEACVPSLLSLVLGPWSDRYGRKPLIVFPFLGYVLMYLVSAILASFANISPWWYVLPCVPVALSGGQCILITGSFCYLTDTVSEEKRGIRMGLLESAVFVGLLIGSLSAPLIYNSFGSTIVFSIAAMSSLMGLIYCCAFIQESVVPNNNIMQSRLRGLFDFSLASDMIRVCCKSRLHWDRAVIWILMLTLGFSILVLEGNATVNYMFVREKFHWTITEYTRFNSASIVLSIIGTCLGIYILSKIFCIGDLLLSIFSQVSSISEAILKAMAYKGWQLYLGASLSMLRGCFGPMIRAFLSKIVPASDIGKVFSLATSIESVTPLAASPVYTLLYTSTFKDFPGAFNILTASIYTVNIVLLVIVYYLHKNKRTYESLNQSLNS